MPEIDKHLVLKNSHIHKDDVAKLEAGSANTASVCLLIHDTDFGWILYVGGKTSKETDTPPWRTSSKMFESEGWKTDFDAIARLAWRYNCSYVTFDADGNSGEGLAEYDW